MDASYTLGGKPDISLTTKKQLENDENFAMPETLTLHDEWYWYLR